MIAEKGRNGKLVDRRFAIAPMMERVD